MEEEEVVTNNATEFLTLLESSLNNGDLQTAAVVIVAVGLGYALRKLPANIFGIVKGIVLKLGENLKKDDS